MLNRLKTASPKWKIFLAIWLAVELISLPAAAGVALTIIGETSSQNEAPVVSDP